MTKGPIVIVEDDEDDLEIYAEVLKTLNVENPLRVFKGAPKALEYLLTSNEQPFIILSDINMPQMTGLQFKEAIQKDDYLRAKGIPFVFISTNASALAVKQAHGLSVQGYFEKPGSIREIENMFKVLFSYWELCKHINNT